MEQISEKKSSKRWRQRLKPVVIFSLILVLAVGLAACGTGQGADDQTTQGSEPGKDVVTVGTMGTYNPFSFAAEDGTLTGYDLEVLREIEKVDGNLTFNFVAGPWDSLFVGLDAGKFQLLANQITTNPDREEKYYLTEIPYFTCVAQIIVKEGRTDIGSLADLQGKAVGLTVGDSFTRLIEDWNEANGNVLDIRYYEQDIVTILEDVSNGRLDATINDPIMARDKASVQGLAIDVAGERLAEDPTYFIFSKDEKGKVLRDRVDHALQQLIDSGRLSELSLEWFGEDYTQ